MKKVSIVIPVYNEAAYIEACLDSVVGFEREGLALEVLVVDGGSRDGTRETIEAYARRYGYIKLLDNPDRIVPKAMNIGIAEATGEYIVRLDAHAIYPKDYVQKLVTYAQRLHADNVGGVVRTEVRRLTPVSCAVRNVLADKLGVGSAFRTGVSDIREVDTVPFGCYRKEIFSQIGLYDERLARNQDIELNKRLKRHGGRIVLVPDIVCTYFARETYAALMRNGFQNGRWNMLTAFYTGTLRSLSVRHYMPMLFVMTLLVSAICCVEVSLGLFLVYLSIILWRSCRIARQTTCPHQVAAFLALHFSYGAGELWGAAEAAVRALKKE